MRKLIFIVYVIIHAMICHAQIENNEQRNTSAMRKLNLEAYNKYRKGNREGCRYITTNENNDSVKIVLDKLRDCYSEHVLFLNSPLREVYEYNINTLKVIFEMEFFYNCPIGFRREYNENGELIKEINNDAPFKFTWQELIVKMREEYGIELWDLKEQRLKNQSGLSVGRDAEKITYRVRLYADFVYYEGFMGRSIERFEIDGTTGKLIKHWGNDNRKHPDTENER